MGTKGPQEEGSITLETPEPPTEAGIQRAVEAGQNKESSSTERPQPSFLRNGGCGTRLGPVKVDLICKAFGERSILTHKFTQFMSPPVGDGSLGIDAETVK